MRTLLLAGIEWVLDRDWQVMAAIAGACFALGLMQRVPL